MLGWYSNSVHNIYNLEDRLARSDFYLDESNRCYGYTKDNGQADLSYYYTVVMLPQNIRSAWLENEPIRVNGTL